MRSMFAVQYFPVNFYDLLWGHVVRFNNLLSFRGVVDFLKTIDARQRGRPVKTLQSFVLESSSFEHRAGLSYLASIRHRWLVAQIGKTHRPLRWKFVDSHSNCPGLDKIKDSLQGPTGEMLVHGFNGIAEARDRVTLIATAVKGALSATACGRGREAYVRLIKIGGEFAEQNGRMAPFKAEVARLENLLGPRERSHQSTSVTSDAMRRKRPREEEDANTSIKSERLS